MIWMAVARLPPESSRSLFMEIASARGVVLTLFAFRVSSHVSQAAEKSGSEKNGCASFCFRS
jgi:hypothetical protein